MQRHEHSWGTGAAATIRREEGDVYRRRRGRVEKLGDGIAGGGGGQDERDVGGRGKDARPGEGTDVETDDFEVELKTAALHDIEVRDVRQGRAIEEDRQV